MAAAFKCDACSRLFAVKNYVRVPIGRPMTPAGDRETCYDGVDLCESCSRAVIPVLIKIIFKQSDASQEVIGPIIMKALKDIGFRGQT